MLKTRAPLPSQSIKVGDTPLIRINKVFPGLDRGVSLYAKAEWHNPGGSVKDRAALRIVQEAESAGLFSPEKTLLDATSGNTGIAYAWICARLGRKLSLAVPGSINAARRNILQAYGAELFFTDPLEGSDGAIREAKLLYAAQPELYFYADQYNNQANWRAHYDSTALEIFKQTKKCVTHFVAGLGTSGTFTGTGRRLKELRPDVRLISVEPDSPLHGLDGLKHMASSIIPGIYDKTVADERLEISTEEGQRAAKTLAQKAGILIGPSGGANLAAALRVVERLVAQESRATVVTIFPDSGERYLNERFWHES